MPLVGSQINGTHDSRLGSKSVSSRPYSSVFVTALVLVLSAPSLAWAQADGIPAPTIQDVDPGVDHGSSEEGLDYQWRKQPVYFRSDYAPGTIVVFTADRYLYLVQ